MKNVLKKRTLRLEQLENRELLSATTWNDAAQADVVVAAEMAATLNYDALVDASAFSAAEVETTQAESTIWRVTNLNDGAVGSLRWAVAQAQDGDSIRFDPSLSQKYDDGTYVKIVLTKGEIEIKNDITIDGYGLYRFEELKGLIHDQDHTGVKVDAQDNSRIFNINAGADVKIVGVHMTNGSVRKDWEPGEKLPNHADASIDAAHDADHHGGALHVPVGAKLTLSMCVVSNSKAIQGGGAVAVSGEFHAADTIFEDNHGGVDHGGAIRIFNGYVEVVDCYFRDNTILPYGYQDGKDWVDKSSSTGGGGAVAASGGAFRSFNSSYTGNSGWYGAAIHVNGGKVLISNNLIVQNGGKARLDGGWRLGCYNGGGVDCDGGTLTIVNSTIADNIAANAGSGLYVNGNTGVAPKVSVYNTIIANNKSESDGTWSASAKNFDVKKQTSTGQTLNVDVYGYYVLSDYTGWSEDKNGAKGVGIINLKNVDASKIFAGDAAVGVYRYNLGPDSPAANVGSGEYASIFHYDETVKDWVRTDEKIECDFVRNERVWSGGVDLGAFERDSQPYYEAILRPENVRFSDYNRDAKTVVVSWDDKSYNELGFRVEISTDGEVWKWVAQVEENVETATISGIEPNKTYYVRVRAEIELSNVSEWSEIAEFTARVYTLDEPAISAKGTSSSEIAFYVGEVENAVGYVYEYSANPDFSNATRGELATAGMLTISELDPYTWYYFRAYAVGTGSYLDSPWSATYARTEQVVLPAPKPSVALTEAEKTTLEFSFNAVEGATKYLYRYSTNPDFLNAKPIEAKEAGSFEIDLQPGQTYYFQVKAIGDGETYLDSEWSASISGTTDGVDLAPPAVSVEETGTNALSFAVGAVANATGYKYRYAASEADLANADWVELDAAGTVSLTGLKGGTTYYFQAMALGDGTAYFNSAESAPVLATTLTIPLAVPKVDATPVNFSTVKFEIGYVAQAGFYVYEYSTSPDFTNATSGTATEAGAFDVSSLNPHTTYYFRAKACRDDPAYEASKWSETAFATTPKIPMATPKIEAVETSASEIELTIGVVEHATGYYCEYSTDPTFRSTNTLMAQAGTITLSGLSPNAKYYIRVLAYGGPHAEVSAWATDDATTQQAKLDAPTPSLLLVNASGGLGPQKQTLQFTFDAIPNATGYKYRYSTDPNFTNDVETVDTTTAGSFTHGNLSAGTTYYFQVKAVGDGVGYVDSDWSTAIFATTSKVNLPAPPVAIQTVGSTALSFNFDAVAGASSYEYRFATTEEGLKTATAKSVSAAGTIELSGLSPVTTYYIQVRSIGNNTSYVTSDWSAPVDATTVKIALNVPEVDAAAVDSTTLTFEIDAVANADWYEYEYSTSRYFTADTTVSGTKTAAGAFNVDGLSPYTTYYFRAKAVVDADTDKSETYESSAWSTYAPATTAKEVLPVPAIEAVATSPTTVALTIYPVANADGYEYYMSTDPNFKDAEPISRGSGTRVLTGLTPGVTYYFSARAKADANDAYVESAWSLPTNATPLIALTAPTITVESLSGSEIKLIFGDLDPNAVSYVYQISRTDDAWSDDAWQVAEFSENGELIVVGLEENATYYFVAKALGDKVTYVDSEVSATATTATSPAVPSNISFSQYYASGSDQMYLQMRWNKPDKTNNNVYHDLEYREVGSTEWVRAFQGTGWWSVKMYDMEPGKSYELRVRALNKFGGYSEWSEIETVDFLAAPEAELIGYNPETGFVEFGWSSLEGAKNYRVEFSKVPFAGAGLLKDDADSRVFVVDASETSYAYASLEPGQTYYFRVRAGHAASNVDGSGYWSEVATFEALTAPSEVVFTIDAADPTTGVLTWTNTAANATNFNVEISTDGQTWERSLTTTETSLTLDSLTPNQRYYIRVQAQSANGASVWTNAAYLTAPSGVNFTQNRVSDDTNDSFLRARWNAVDGAIGYLVEYREVGATDWSDAQKTRGKFVDVVGLNPDASYEFRVCALDELGGRSAWSEVETVRFLAAPTAELIGFDAAKGRVEIGWSSVDDAKNYRLEFSTVPFADSTLSSDGADCRVFIADASASSRVYASLKPGQTYYFRVRVGHGGENASGASAWSNVVKFTVPGSESASTDVVSEAFADLFAEEVENDFWFELEKTLGSRK